MRTALVQLGSTADVGMRARREKWKAEMFHVHYGRPGVLGGGVLSDEIHFGVDLAMEAKDRFTAYYGTYERFIAELRKNIVCPACELGIPTRRSW